jgi:hypothetical protein
VQFIGLCFIFSEEKFASLEAAFNLLVFKLRVKIVWC